jgi:hypothetical protein
MGAALNLIRRVMNREQKKSRCDVEVWFYAIRLGTEDHMTEQLRETVGTRNGKQETSGGTLNVNFVHFAGPLIGYDNPPLSGIEWKSLSSDHNEAYELLKLSGGTVRFKCGNDLDGEV